MAMTTEKKKEVLIQYVDEEGYEERTAFVSGFKALIQTVEDEAKEIAEAIKKSYPEWYHTTSFVYVLEENEKMGRVVVHYRTGYYDEDTDEQSDGFIIAQFKSK